MVDRSLRWKSLKKQPVWDVGSEEFGVGHVMLHCLVRDAQCALESLQAKERPRMEIKFRHHGLIDGIQGHGSKCNCSMKRCR